MAVTQEEESINNEQNTGDETPLTEVTTHTVASIATLAKLDANGFIMASESQANVEKYQYIVDLIEIPSGLQGLNGSPIETQHKGIIPGLDESIASDEDRENVLSLALVEEVADIEYTQYKM